MQLPRVSVKQMVLPIGSCVRSWEWIKFILKFYVMSQNMRNEAFMYEDLLPNASIAENLGNTRSETPLTPSYSTNFKS